MQRHVTYNVIQRRITSMQCNQHRINVDAMSRLCIDVYGTSYKSHVPAVIFYFFLFSVAGTYEGCYPNYELSTVHMYSDITTMTVDSCILACTNSGKTHVGLQVRPSEQMTLYNVTSTSMQRLDVASMLR